MNKAKKILTLVCCLMMVACLTVGATLAYLTDTTSEVKNTFVVGDVEIKLDETDVDDSTPNEERDIKNNYHIIPGETYVKDPTVEVISVDPVYGAYIRMVVTVDAAQIRAAFPDKNNTTYWAGNIFLLQSLTKDWNDDNWECVKADENDEGEFEYHFYYRNDEGSAIVKTPDVLPDLFQTLTIPKEMTATQIAALNNIELNVVAHAMQAAGFVVNEGEDPEVVAWTTFDGLNAEEQDRR